MVAARPNSPAFALRPMTTADAERAYAITREAMREYVEQTWGPWIEADQRERHAPERVNPFPTLGDVFSN
jgi:hypothetical protein